MASLPRRQYSVCQSDAQQDCSSVLKRAVIYQAVYGPAIDVLKQYELV
jgi:hypothetical protein